MPIPPISPFGPSGLFGSFGLFLAADSGPSGLSDGFDLSLVGNRALASPLNLSTFGASSIQIVGGLNLQMTAGIHGSGLLPISLSGFSSDTAALSLTIKRPYLSSARGFALAVHGHGYVASGLPITLPLAASPANRGFGIALVADDVPSLTSSLPFSAFGSSRSGIIGGVDFLAFSDLDGMSRARPIPISLAGAASDVTVGAMNLWTRGSARPASASLGLTTCNTQSGLPGAANLYVHGLGQNDGYFPYSNSIPMTLARDPAAAILLLIAAPGSPSASGFPLAITGGHSSASGVPMAIPGAIGSARGPTKLYVSGY